MNEKEKDKDEEEKEASEEEESEETEDASDEDEGSEETDESQDDESSDEDDKGEDEEKEEESAESKEEKASDSAPSSQSRRRAKESQKMKGNIKSVVPMWLWIVSVVILLGFSVEEIINNYYLTGYFGGFALLQKFYFGNIERAVFLTKKKNYEAKKEFCDEVKSFLLKNIHLDL